MDVSSLEVGSDLGDCGSRVQDRVDDVLGAGGRTGNKDAGDVGPAGIKIPIRFGDVEVLVEAPASLR